MGGEWGSIEYEGIGSEENGAWLRRRGELDEWRMELNRGGGNLDERRMGLNRGGGNWMGGERGLFEEGGRRWIAGKSMQSRRAIQV